MNVKTLGKLLISLPIFFFIVLLLCCIAASAKTDKQFDQYVANTPAVVERSIPSLAAYLKKAGNTDEKKARAIYRWITENIRYNFNLLSEQNLDTSAGAVLKKRVSVCDGYSNLFISLAKTNGLTAEKIVGQAKGDPFGTAASGRGHSWIAVKINDNWQLLDCTWGAGYLDENNAFVPSQSDYYFLTSPEEFIYGHFPDDPKWQLLDPQLSKEQFDELITVNSLFFQYGIKAASHRYSMIQATEKAAISLTAPKDILFLASLYQDNEKIEDSTFVQRLGDKVVVSVIFPQGGEYQMRIFAKNFSEKAYKNVIEYNLEVKAGNAGKVGFVKALGDYYFLGGVLHTPMSRYLKEGEEIIFDIDVPRAEEVVLAGGDSFVALEKEGEQRFTGKITASKGILMVAGKVPGDKALRVLLEYIVE